MHVDDLSRWIRMSELLTYLSFYTTLLLRIIYSPDTGTLPNTACKNLEGSTIKCTRAKRPRFRTLSTSFCTPGPYWPTGHRQTSRVAFFQSNLKIGGALFPFPL